MGLFAVGFKWTVIGGINFFLCWAGIGLITFGGILSNKLPGSLELGGTMGLKAPLYLIIIGVFTLMITFPGCYGTFRQNHYLLYMYGGMMGVVFVILLSGSITIFNFQVCTLSFFMQPMKLKRLLSVVLICFHICA